MKLQTVGLLSALVLLPCVAANGNACAFQQVYTGSFSRTGTATGTRRLDTGFSLRSSLMEDATETETARTPTLSELPPILQDIVDERNEFRLNLGRAMDVLKQDYPEILRKTPGMYQHVCCHTNRKRVMELLCIGLAISMHNGIDESPPPHETNQPSRTLSFLCIQISASITMKLHWWIPLGLN